MNKLQDPFDPIKVCSKDCGRYTSVVLLCGFISMDQIENDLAPCVQLAMVIGELFVAGVVIPKIFRISYHHVNHVNKN